MTSTQVGGDVATEVGVAEPDPARDRPPAPRSVRQAWARLGLGKRIVVAVVVLFAVAQAVSLATETVIGGGEPGGPASSSYSTAGDGYGAWADLLVQQGHPVTQLRAPLAKARLEPASTVVVADPDLVGRGDAVALVRFVAAGGRLVVTGRTGAPLLDPFAGRPLVWRSDGLEAARLLEDEPPHDAGIRAAGVRQISGSGRGSYAGTGSLQPVIGADGEVTVAVGRSPAGGGVAVGVADSGVFANGRLAQQDNAALALALAGPPSRPVVFVESVHGYGTGTGLAALPPAWKWTAGGLLIAVLCALWAAGQRFGPPERAHRDLPPPRRAYVDALAADLARADPSPERARAMLRDADPDTAHAEGRWHR